MRIILLIIVFKIIEQALQPTLQALQKRESQYTNMIHEQNLKFDVVLQTLQTKQTHLDQFIQRATVYSDKLESLMESATTLHHDFKNNVERSKIASKILTKRLDKIQTYEEQVKDIITNTETQLQQTKIQCDDYYNNTRKKCDRTIENLRTNNPQMDQTDPTINRKFQKLKENTKLLAQQYEDEYELLNDRLQKMEVTVQALRK